MKYKFEIDFGQGYQTVGVPENWKGVMPSIAFGSSENRPILNTGLLVWVKDEAQKILQYVRNSATGNGPIIGVGLPTRVWDNDWLVQPLFDGLINFADESYREECDKVVAQLLDKRVDWMTMYADAFGFTDLYDLAPNSAGKISLSDFKKTPYSLSDLPDRGMFLIMVIEELEIVKMGLDTVRDISMLSSKSGGDMTTDGIQLGTSTPTVVADGVIIFIYITELILVIAAFIVMMIKLLGELMQPKKYKYCMREVDLWVKGCEYLGLNFVSSIYGHNTPSGYNNEFNDATVMPNKNLMLNAGQWLNPFARPANDTSNADAVGFPVNGTFGDWIKTMMVDYDGICVIRNGNLYFENRWNFNSVNPGFQIPNTSLPGYVKNLPDPHGNNLSELPTYYLFQFKTDATDLNTEHRYTGTTCSATILFAGQSTPRKVVWGKSTIVPSNYALAKRKESLTRVEDFVNNVLNVFFSIVNDITSAINSITSVINSIISFFGGPNNAIPAIPQLQLNIIWQRIGWMELSGDIFAIPKKFIGVQVGQDWELHPQTEAVMSAFNLAQKFHFKNLPTRGAQALKYFDKVFPFCTKDFANVLDYNIITTPDGKKGKFDQLYWDIYHGSAKQVNYRIFTTFMQGLSERIMIDGNP